MCLLNILCEIPEVVYFVSILSERPYRRYGSLLRTVPQVPLVGQATGNQHHAVNWPLIPGSSEEANHRPQLPKMLLSKVAMELFR